jgi:hypothetical protein
VERLVIREALEVDSTFETAEVANGVAAFVGVASRGVKTRAEPSEGRYRASIVAW